MSSPPRAGLLDWLAAPRADRGLRFRRSDGGWELRSYADLAKAVARRAEELADLEHGSAVALIHDTGPDFIVSFFAVLAAGGTPTPLAPPDRLDDRDSWADRVAQALAAGVSAAVCEERFAAGVRSAALRTGRPCRVLVPEQDGAPDDADVPLRPPAELALLQFTSGSRGARRATRVSWENLEANVAMVRHWVDMRDRVGVSWLPLHHDMGLIGGLLGPVLAQADQGLMRPEQFIRSPLAWLREYDQDGGEIVAMPNFGFDYLARRLKPQHVAGLDLSGVRSVVSGSERIRRETLEAFLRLLIPCGLRPAAMQPGYGLAEATLGVTGVRRGEPVRMVALAPGPIRLGENVPIIASAHLDGAAAEPGDHVWHVSCGAPLEGVMVDIVGDDGRPVPEGHLGEIAVRGPAVALGYAAADDTPSTRFEAGRLLTADAGFRSGGELYVVGRIGDSLQVRGRNLYVEDIEQLLADDIVFPWKRTVVLAGYQDAQATVLIATETGFSGREAQVVELVSTVVGPDAAVRAWLVAPCALEFTSSGKPRRRRMWERVLAGDLKGEVLAESESRAAAAQAGEQR